MTAMHRWQIGLIATGLTLLLVGGIVLLNQVDPSQYLGIAIWFLGALILHDGIAAAVVFGLSLLMRRSARRIPLPVIAIVQAALVVAAVMTALVLPAILKQGIGTDNPSVLPLAYGPNLLLFYAGLAAVTAVAIGVYLVLASRQKDRPSISHD